MIFIFGAQTFSMKSEVFYIVLVALIPAILVALAAYILIKQFLDAETRKREFEIRKIGTELITPQRLSAYERMALFLERIKPTALVMRVSAASTAKNYERLLIETVQSEWEYNLSQQIYVNPDTWKIIYSAKNATQNFIRECAAELEGESTAVELQEHIIKKSIAENAPSQGALLKLQVDIQGGM